MLLAIETQCLTAFDTQWDLNIGCVIESLNVRIEIQVCMNPSTHQLLWGIALVCSGCHNKIS